VPGNVPAPLIDNAPGPVHGRPVSGFVPVVLVRSPVGVDGETLSSDRADKSVLCPLSTGLVVFPLSNEAPVFCAGDTVVVTKRRRILSPRSSMRFAAMWVDLTSRIVPPPHLAMLTIFAIARKVKPYAGPPLPLPRRSWKQTTKPPRGRHHDRFADAWRGQVLTL
jgi:hypothetical protein